MQQNEVPKLIEEIIKSLDKEAGVEVVEQGEGYLIKVDSPDAGLLIGKQGETLEALQYLLRVIAARKSEKFTPLSLDIAGYKQTRDEELKELALAVAKNVNTSGFTQELRPMSSYERRIVHSALTDLEGVETESIGNGNLRRVQVRKKE